MVKQRKHQLGSSNTDLSPKLKPIDLRLSLSNPNDFLKTKKLFLQDQLSFPKDSSRLLSPSNKQKEKSNDLEESYNGNLSLKGSLSNSMTSSYYKSKRFQPLSKKQLETIAIRKENEINKILKKLYQASINNFGGMKSMLHAVSYILLSHLS